LELAQQHGGTVRPYQEMADALREADIVITSTGASTPILSPALIGQAMHDRTSRPLILLDIAVPRDADPQVREMEGVYLYDLDHLQAHLGNSLSQRQNEVDQVEAIIQEELDAFAHWMEVIPVVGRLHRKAENIRQQEVERALNHLPELSPEARAQIELFSRSLVKKLLHEPTTRLRAESHKGQLGGYMDTLEFLFGLDTHDA
jgi:glutamyl-tRNA reductase